ncbi:P-loop containing nucleoside triphosphate hydrolase protein [Paraphoma chrysanthemicola]|uniref:P-loop containing nucleoside triphosphate hydrolase protein n=1 Tax=Paraphoma chrysanthemicola TaxID=798071 RepID=A0A8K0VVZ9_9PLEO|nr:P-loop containing nucleoside triphosphate hydrolase protein [Paraphoma chrysanthemicola]
MKSAASTPHNKPPPYVPPEGYPDQAPVVIVVMGVCGVGKSTLIKYVTGQEVVVGHGQEACTSEVTTFQIPGTNVWMVDTPGFDDTFNDDGTILDRVDQSLAEFFDQFIPIAGMLYIHDITKARMQGSAMKNLSMFRKVVGDQNLKNCCIVTTKWSQQDQAVLSNRENELKTKKHFWQTLIALGVKTARFEDSKESVLSIVKPLVEGKGFIPQITVETRVEGKLLADTKAGEEVYANITKLEKQHQATIDDLKQLHKELVGKKEEDAAEAERLVKEEMDKLKEELRGLKTQKDIMTTSTAERSSGGRIIKWMAWAGARTILGVTTLIGGAALCATANPAGAAAGTAVWIAGANALAAIDRAFEGD